MFSVYTMRLRFSTLFVLTTALLLLAGCKPVTAPPATAAAPVAAPEATPAPIATPASLPPALEYNLGDATLVQERFPEDSRFRNMPVRLNGVIAVPEGDGGPYPVAVILHGTHPGCPVMGDIDPWPCAPEEEQPNYRGFGYLASALAAKGYVVLVPNINAENTFGFGEPTPHERLGQLLDLQLQALAEAAAGGENKFGVDLAGRADLHRLALLGHSRGGEAAVALANNPDSALGSPRRRLWTGGRHAARRAGRCHVRPGGRITRAVGNRHLRLRRRRRQRRRAVLLRSCAPGAQAAMRRPRPSTWSTPITTGSIPSWGAIPLGRRTALPARRCSTPKHSARGWRTMRPTF